MNFLPRNKTIDKMRKHKRAKALEQIKKAERVIAKRHLSKFYVLWLKMLQKVKTLSKRDMLSKYLPFATGYAIITGYRYLCPGSRHLYTARFKSEVFEECSHLLLSYEFSPASIRITRLVLFPMDAEAFIEEPEESCDDFGEKGVQERFVDCSRESSDVLQGLMQRESVH